MAILLLEYVFKEQKSLLKTPLTKACLPTSMIQEHTNILCNGQAKEFSSVSTTWNSGEMTSKYHCFLKEQNKLAEVILYTFKQRDRKKNAKSRQEE